MIFHIALPSDWAQAQASGYYTMSTRGVTLEQEGFIHASRDLDQAEAVRRLFYSDLDGLLLLRIDESKVEAEVRLESPPGSDELFPHIYGPLPVSAVVSAEPL